MDRLTKTILQGLVAEIDRLNKLEKEIDVKQAFEPNHLNIDELRQLENVRNSYQNKINTIIKGL